MTLSALFVARFRLFAGAFVHRRPGRKGGCAARRVVRVAQEAQLQSRVGPFVIPIELPRIALTGRSAR
jgi:hypothetical protein